MDGGSVAWQFNGGLRFLGVAAMKDIRLPLPLPLQRCAELLPLPLTLTPNPNPNSNLTPTFTSNSAAPGSIPGCSPETGRTMQGGFVRLQRTWQIY